MGHTIKPGPASAARISDFLGTYGIRALTIAATTRLDKRTGSAARLQLIHDAKGGKRDYTVTFTLPDECVDMHEYIQAFDTKAGITIALNEKGQSLTRTALDDLISAFFASITPHVKKIRKEESVQAIRYVGNTFVLYNTTTFKVLSDDGEGRLEIEILSRDKDLQAAGMTSHALLDGLYSGAIQVLEGESLSHPGLINEPT